jgi:glucan phosphoethanolaminetransferase (alkaline phosphatase superfamily)
LSERDKLLPRTMLGIMDVQTKVYDGALDLFKPCRAG